MVSMDFADVTFCQFHGALLREISSIMARSARQSVPQLNNSEPYAINKYQ